MNFDLLRQSWLLCGHGLSLGGETVVRDIYILYDRAASGRKDVQGR